MYGRSCFYTTIHGQYPFPITRWECCIAGRLGQTECCLLWKWIFRPAVGTRQLQHEEREAVVTTIIVFCKGPLAFVLVCWIVWDRLSIFWEGHCSICSNFEVSVVCFVSVWPVQCASDLKGGVLIRKSSGLQYPAFRSRVMFLLWMSGITKRKFS